MSTTVVAVDHPPVTGEGWLVAPQTDRKGRIYLDRSFCVSVPLHVVAGALEHEYAKISRGVFTRLSWVSPEDWDDIAVPAFQLEIMDAMEREKVALTDLRIERRVSASTQFSLYDFDDWDVAGPPSLTEVGAMTPSLLGLPERRSAETYAQLLFKARDESMPDMDGDDADGDGLVLIAQGEETLGDAPQSEEVGAGQDGSGASARADGADAAQGDDAAADDGEAGQAAAPSEQDSQANETEPEGADTEGGDGDASPSADADGPEQSDAQGCGRSDPAATAQQVLSDAGGPSKVDAKRRAALRNPDTLAWSKSVPHYGDEFASDIKPRDEDNAKPVSDLDLNDAINESARMTVRHAFLADSGIDGQSLDSAQRRLRSLGLSWDRHLVQVVSSCLVSERVRGASDLTYSSLNPNQPQEGVRLMGMTDYAPTVTIIQDVSGSMTATMATAMDVTADLLTAVTGRLQARSTWVTVDHSIVAVGEAATMTQKVRRQMDRGGGGTALGPVISSLMGKGKPMVWRGHTLRAPDLLVVSTDGKFTWPKERPSRAHRLVVVVYDERHIDCLPDWVNSKRELVLVGS
jgi:hypothetical protein